MAEELNRSQLDTLDRDVRKLGLSESTLEEVLSAIRKKKQPMIDEENRRHKERIRKTKCWTCMDTKQVEERRIGYDSIMGPCPDCRYN